MLRAKVDKESFFQNLDEMLDKKKPEAVIVYEDIYDHLRVIEACAQRGIHVMVEKPLATTTAQAKRIEELVRKYHIMFQRSSKESSSCLDVSFLFRLSKIYA